MTLICDTSVVYASLVRGDRAHVRCAETLRDRDDVVIPAPVLVEVDALGRSRRAHGVTDALLRSIEDNSVEVADLVRRDYIRARALAEQYGDLRLGFVDAAIVALAERLGQIAIATLDHRHFSVVRPVHCEAFTLVP